ncbi:MAG: lytic transglycosylase domain-containing protein [Hydrogenophaga sp.]|uniref:lytic transglycosylase domain-containing protein n=1 Tax=Hydrogenophaga sp. TaxID=1904254 RepID=UPI002716A34C|nr:lytic transglycosylase domain-containing protein [Hydrogenophaga sp.]MDO9029291.1 lytic transglycosylase domain-containing protein [Hydrogenophaga sp.]
MNDTTTSHHKSTPGAKASLNTALSDVVQGFLAITHNSVALLGTVLAVGLITLAARHDLRSDAEQHLLGWLQQRQVAAAPVVAFEPEPEAVQRVTAVLPTQLPKQQANVAFWLSRKYRVAPEPLGVLVAEAFEVGEKARMDPTLILAVMAVESRFNPFAQSPVGAQGLMQVLTRVHTEKYEDFGGQLAAFDPVSNLRVGAQVLQDCIKRAGSIEGGLRLYVGAVTTDGSGYINKVMAEHLRIQSVALGKPMPTRFPSYRTIPVVAPADTETLPAPDATELEAADAAPPVAETVEPLLLASS